MPIFYGRRRPSAWPSHESRAMGNRVTDIDEIAPLVVFLADEGYRITGQTIFANGCYTTR